MKTFEEKQAELLKRQEEETMLFNLEIKYNKLTGIENIISFVHYGRNFIGLRPKTVEELKKALSIKPTNKFFVIEYGDRKIKVEDAYRLDIANGVHDKKFQISFEDGLNDIQIELPITGDIASMFTMGDRKVTDSELHYFTCQTRNQIDKIAIKTFNFQSDSTFTYYGGHIVLADTAEITEIISNLKELTAL